MGLGNLTTPLIFGALVGTLAGLWLIMATDLSRRELSTGARLAWWVLLIFAPGLGLLVYYFTVVSPGIGRPSGLSSQAGGLLVSNRGQTLLFLAAIGSFALLVLMVTPVSFEILPTTPVRVP